jgi:hypothetical protein
MLGFCIDGMLLEKVMCLITEIMQGLIKAKEPISITSRKAGRPSTSSLENQNKDKCKKVPAAAIPTSEVWLDQTGHLPSFEGKKGRCTVHLCFKTNADSFLTFHFDP